jgi:predicted DNA-binding transcriptional regulator AlpA
MAEDLLTEDEVARILRISTRSLRRYRADGSGPPWIRISERVYRYPRGELEAWLKAQHGRRE